MGGCLCLFRNPLALASALLVPVSATVCFLGYGYLPILFTALFLVVSSPFFLTSSKHLSLRDNDESHIQTDDAFQNKREDQEVEDHQGEEVHGYNKVGPQMDSFSESETSIDHSSSITDDQEEDSEVDWPYGTNLGDRSPDYYSDGSISDEESLIEIDLPGGHYVASPPKQEELKKKKSFKQNNTTLMELLAEINEMYEEDNLIEIDISMGSIKCSKFEIAA